MRATGDLERMRAVAVHRERRAQRRVIDGRRELNRVLQGLAGAGDIKGVLVERLRQPAAVVSTVAELAAAQGHATVIDRQLREVERLEQRALIHSEQLRRRIAQHSQHWQKAQYRLERVDALRELRRRTEASRDNEAAEEDAVEIWLGKRRRDGDTLAAGNAVSLRRSGDAVS